ncbi:zinc finger protein 436-like [Bicyclus anynana]|uniref:Zinc finger protein 436-like n=1 Tax=Bicyclus anynana TaxID=110368 RepID=A0A6J1P0Q2_BICAN|nr:zinc finger protein 436-like [Bicyclus anynana]
MQCCVPFCANTSDNVSTSEGTGITFHKLPSEQNLRAVWLRALSIQDHHLPDPAVVCSLHFVDEDFYATNSSVRQIRSDAIPSTVQIKSESVVDVATLVLKREDSSDCMSNAGNSELVHEDDNQRDKSNNDCVSEDEYSDVSIKLESMLVDEAVAEHVTESETYIKIECAIFECTLCYEDFVQEDAYKEHMIMHLQNAACDASQVCEPRAAVSRSCDSLVLQNKTGSQRLNDAPPPAAGCAQATVAPLSARLAAINNKVQATEEVGATWKSEQILETDIDELDNQLPQSNANTLSMYDINRLTNCVVRLCDIYKKPKKTVLDKNPRVKSHTGAKPHSCETCNYKTAYKSHLVNHRRTHTGEKPYSCETCDFKTAYQCHLVSHRRTHTGEKPYSCETCNFKCLRKRDLLVHKRTHTGEKPYSCKTCNFKTARKSYLIIHERYHTGEKPYSCEMCNFKAAQKSHIILHKRNHSSEKPYSCDICNYKTADKSYLTYHMKTHTGEKPFSCETCNYKCAQKSHLKRHNRTHTGEKPYFCDICNYKTAKKDSLISHMKTHTGNKPYSCKHTGEKPFSCETCNYKCALKSNLKIHNRTHTGEKPLS